LCTAQATYAYDFEVDGIYYNKLSGDSVEVTYGGTAKKATDSYTGSIAIPSSVVNDGVTYSVTSIGKNAFYDCIGLVSINIPEGITSIGNHSFYGCKGLIAVKIPQGVTSIGEYAFYNCSGLVSVNIPKGVTSIEERTFYDCEGLTSINIPQGVTSIGKGAFSSCYNLTSVYLPEGVISIGEDAFNWCTSLTSITIPKSVTSIGESAFSCCQALTSINIPQSVTSIGEYALNSSIKEVSVYSVDSWIKMNNIIGTHKFGLTKYSLIVNGLKITDLVIPDDITMVGMYTFHGCTGLESITFHKDVTAILQNAFNGCTNVKKIVCQGDTPPACGADALTEISRTECILHVPETSKTDYQNTAPWNEFTNIVGGSTETPDAPKTCETPTITFDNTTMQLNFSCATEGAECHYSITSEDIQSGKTGDNAQLTGVYDITAYASATGFYNSETTTAKLCWVNIEGETTGVLNANMQRGLIVTTLGESIIVKGTVNGGVINVYNAAGSLVMNINTTDGETIINGLSAGNVYIVKIGGTSVKVAL